MRYAIACMMILGARLCLSQTPDQRATHGVNFGSPIEHGIVASPTLNEISGVVASETNPKVLWVNNDSGDQPQIYALATSGKLVCTVKISNASHRDWEDIAIGPGPDPKQKYLYIGEIGDNGGKATSIIVYRIPEPVLDPNVAQMTVSAERFEFNYPDGPRDAEALIIDPVTQDLFVISKREKHGRIYRAKAPLIPSAKTTLSFEGELPFTLVTAADISSKGNEVLVKNYVFVYHWTRNGSEPLSAMFKRVPIRLNYMPEPQGEALCFSATGDGFYTLSEIADTSVDYPVMFYPREKGKQQTQNAATMEKQNIFIEPSPDTPGMFVLRYNVQTYSPIRISVVNEAMMEVENVESSTSEQGIQEREIDMIDKPSGTYVVVLHEGRKYLAVPLEVKKR